MSPRRNPFSSPPGTRSHTNGEVSRAGEFLLGFYYEPRRFEDETQDKAYISEAVEALRTVHWWRDQHARPLATASQGLRYHVRQVTGDEAQVTQRLKRVPTMIDKLRRHEHMELGRMWDIGGVRARLPSVDAVYDVVDRLSRWKTRGQPHDYIANPKADGYRAYHLYVEKGKSNKRVVEIQLRTELQDTWANQVERDSRMGPGYKFGHGEPAVRNYFRLVSEIFASQDAGQPVPQVLRTQLRESYDELKSLSDPRENPEK